MKSTAAFKKNLFAHSDDPWVQVLVPGHEGLSDKDIYAFRAHDIKSLRGFGPAHTVMKLQDGQEFLIALSYESAMEKLDQPDSGRVDFSTATMTEGKEALVKKLKEEFRRAQELQKEPDIAAVTIKAFVRASQSSKFTPFTFAGKDIRLSDIKEGNSVHGGPTVNMTFYADAAAPFGKNEVIIEGRLEEFRRLCAEAVAKGEDTVDLSEYSMRKFKETSPAEARRQHEQKSP
ncbi:MAG: hypothetical protein Q8K65_05370 [Alphaproteobacteria bacterium]|nr:hypothetical protein [Alphaproteobacteria bacterium]